MGYPILQNNVRDPLRFLLVLASDHITGALGKTPAVQILKNGAVTWETPAGAVSELGGGSYQVAPNAADASYLGPLSLRVLGAAGCDPVNEEFTVLSNLTGLSVGVTGPLPGTTVRDLIHEALFDLGVLQAGEVAPESAQTAFRRLNDWMNALPTQALSVYQTLRTTWILTGAASYTVGVGGTIPIDRPLQPQDILGIGYVNNAANPPYEQQQGLPLTGAQYRAIPQKTFTGLYPQRWYYEPTYPLGTLSVYPVPTGPSLLGVIYAPVAVPSFASLNDVVALPPGYQRFLRTNLAVELAAPFQMPPTAELFEAARDSKADVKRRNYRPSEMLVITPFSGGGGEDFYSGV